MKIAFLVSSLKKCGPTKQLFYLTSLLVENGNEVTVVTIGFEPEETLLPQFVKTNVKVIQLEIPLSRIALKANKLKRAFLQIKPDVVHSHLIKADFLSTLFLRKKYQRIATARSYAFEDYSMSYGKFWGSIMSMAQMYCFKRMDGVYAVSETLSNKLRKKGVESETIYNSIDVGERNVIKSQSADIRKSLGIDDEAIVIVSVGNLIPLKNSQVLLEWFNEYKKGRNCYLWMLGEGVQKAEFVAKYADSQTHFFGQVPNVPDYLNESNLFVSCSLSEGLPNAVLEALLHELPVVLSDIDQHKEILSKDDRCGELFELEKQASFTRQMEQALNRIKNGEYNPDMARKLVEDHFDRKKMVASYMEVYSRLGNRNED